MTQTRGRTALGKGLNALFPGSEPTANRDYFMCAVDRIDPDPDQPRRHFDDAALDELSASIREKGIIQPLVVRRNGNRYLIIAGERRFRAATKAGLTDVPVLVKDVASSEALELALIENIQRQDLNPIEEASAFQRLIDEVDYTQEVLAQRLGKKRSTVANALRLLRLSPPQQQLLTDGKLTAGHARCLLAFDDQKTRDHLADRILGDQLSVRQSEALVKEIKVRTPPRPRTSRPSQIQPYCDTISVVLSEALGAPVRVSARGRKGQITIQFHDLADLRRLAQQVAPSVDVSGAHAQVVALG